MPRVTDSRAAWLVSAAFFLSGLCTLVYQIVWVRMLILVFGTSVFAVSTVLTAFMGGLALGAVWLGRRADRIAHPLRLYAWLELGIGAFALVFPLILSGLDDLYTAVYRLLGGQATLFVLVRFLLVLLVLLVPTTLMGATLPVLTRWAVRRLTAVGRSVGRLYAVNTFGAAAGTLIASFVLIERFGVLVTTLIAVAGNVLVAGIAFLLARREQAGEIDLHCAAAPPVEDGSPPLSPALARLVFWGYAVSGFTALGYEVLWTRALSVVLRITTTQSLAAILVTYLGGLACGSAVGARISTRRPGAAAFGAIEIAIGWTGLLSVIAVGWLPELRAWLGPPFSWSAHMLRLFVLVGAVVFLPTFLMGMLFPVASRLHVRELDRVGAKVGGIYGANTAGAILGAAVSGFVLLPLLGTQTGIQLLGWINVAIGAMVLWMAPALPLRRRQLLPALGLIAALGLWVAVPANWIVWRYAPRAGELLFAEEDAGGTVTVQEFADGKRLLRVNGAGEVPTDHASIQTFRLLGNLPLLVHADPRQVMVIAFGGGVTLSAVERHAPERLDCVEVVPGVVHAGPWFEAFNNRVYERLDGKPIHLIVDDGRNHVLRTARHYDVILSDSTHPATADSWVLYTREFYELSRNRLAPGGVFAQWLPLHGLAADDYRMILRTFRSVFPHATLWVTPGYSVMLATPETLRIDPARLARNLARPELHPSLEEADRGDPVSFLAALALDEDALGEYVGDGPINRDDLPYIGFRDRTRTGTQTGAPVAASLVPHLVTAARHVAGADPELVRRVERRLRARRHTVAAHVYLGTGRRDEALAELKRAWEIDPEEKGMRRAVAELERARRAEARAGGRQIP